MVMEWTRMRRRSLSSSRGGGGGGVVWGRNERVKRRGTRSKREGERERRESVVCGAQISSNELKNGVSLELDGTPFKVVEFMHVKPGKGAAFVRSKLKNAITGNVIDKVRERKGTRNENDDHHAIMFSLCKRDCEFTERRTAQHANAILSFTL